MKSLLNPFTLKLSTVIFLTAHLIAHEVASLNLVVIQTIIPSLVLFFIQSPTCLILHHPGLRKDKSRELREI